MSFEVREWEGDREFGAREREVNQKGISKEQKSETRKLGGR